MIKSVILINYQNKPLEITLTDPYQHGIYIENIEGLGYPQSTNHFTKIASNPVQFYNSVEISERNIVIYFGIIGNNDVETSRHLLYDYLIQGISTLLVFKTDQRFVYTNAYIESVDSKIFDQQETVQVSFICGDPYFRDWHLYEQIDKPRELRFSFSKWFLEEGLRPVSVSKNEETMLVNFNANNLDFSGFELAIMPIGTGFDKTVIEYNGGKIVFNPNGMDYYAKQAMENGQSFTMVGGIPKYTPLNMFTDERIDKDFGYRMEPNHGPGYLSVCYRDDNWYIEKVLKNSVENIEPYCTIEGDFPELKIGMNTFKIATYGFVSGIINNKEDTEKMEGTLDKIGETTRDIINSYSEYGGYMWIISTEAIPESSYQLKIECGASIGTEKKHIPLFFIETDPDMMEAYPQAGFIKENGDFSIPNIGILSYSYYLSFSDSNHRYGFQMLHYFGKFDNESDVDKFIKEKVDAGILYEYERGGCVLGGDEFISNGERFLYVLRFIHTINLNGTWNRLIVPIKITGKVEDYSWDKIFSTWKQSPSSGGIYGSLGNMSVIINPYLKRYYSDLQNINESELNKMDLQKRIYLGYSNANSFANITIKKNNSYNAL